MASTVRGSSKIEALLGVSPLANIPYLKNTYEKETQVATRKYIVVAMVVSIFVMIVVIHFIFTPIDVLWFKYLRKAEILLG